MYEQLTKNKTSPQQLCIYLYDGDINAATSVFLRPLNVFMKNSGHMIPRSTLFLRTFHMIHFDTSGET